MPPLFQSLLFLDERASLGSHVWNMAVDEALLTRGEGPVLRVYRWDRPAVSFGYFLPFSAAENVAQGRPVVRRWTGGGIVEHGQDFTWSLIVPASHPASRARPVESYGAIHAALAVALRDSGIVVRQAGAEIPAPTAGMCMSAPAPGDLLLADRKIAGAGQRRCRHGLLHQGSICGVSLPEDFPDRLAAALSEDVRDFPAKGGLISPAQSLVESRYGCDSWLRLR